MRHNTFDTLVRRIRRCFSFGQYTTGVKDIQTFILHCTHIEIIHGHDHKNIQIVFTTIALFIPTHGFFQTVHRMLALINILRLHINAQRHFTLTHGREGVFNTPQVTGHHSKQIGRFFKGIFPCHPMTPLVVFTLCYGITIGEQNRVTVFFCMNCRGKATHHIWAI